MLVGYLRHSVLSLEAEEVQREALRAAGVQDEDVIVEFAVASDRRPLLEKTVEALQPGDVLVTPKLESLGRSLTDLVTVVLTVARRGADLCALDGAIDTSGGGSEATLKLFEALAVYDTNLTREQERARMAVMLRRGRAIRGPSAGEAKRIVGALKSGATRQAVGRAFGVHLHHVEKLARELETSGQTVAP